MQPADPATPFDIAAIRRHWQPLDWQRPTPLTSEERQYAHFYGIDFDQHLADIQHSFGYFDAAGFRLACHLWRPDKRCRGTALVGHGYFDHVGLYRRPVGQLLRLGYAVVAFDLPGHGLSSGETAAIDDFEQYQTVLRTCLDHMQPLPQPWHWLAQSTGGAIAMDFLLHAEAPVPFEKVILLAPLVWPVGWRTGKYLHFFLSPFIKTLTRRFATNSHDTAFLDFLAHQDPLQARRLSIVWVTAWRRWLPRLQRAAPSTHPLMVIQGTGDHTVDWQRNLPEITRLFPAATIHRLPEARHQLVNESDVFQQQISALIDACLNPES